MSWRRRASDHVVLVWSKGWRSNSAKGVSSSLRAKGDQCANPTSQAGGVLLVPFVLFTSSVDLVWSTHMKEGNPFHPGCWFKSHPETPSGTYLEISGYLVAQPSWQTKLTVTVEKEFSVCHSLGRWPCLDYLTSLSLIFFICKLDMIISTSQECCKN